MMIFTEGQRPGNVMLNNKHEKMYYYDTSAMFSLNDHACSSTL